MYAGHKEHVLVQIIEDIKSSETLLAADAFDTGCSQLPEILQGLKLVESVWTLKKHNLGLYSL